MEIFTEILKRNDSHCILLQYTLKLNIKIIFKDFCKIYGSCNLYIQLIKSHRNISKNHFIAKMFIIYGTMYIHTVCLYQKPTLSKHLTIPFTKTYTYNV
jgi:hypothetical protein